MRTIWILVGLSVALLVLIMSFAGLGEKRLPEEGQIDRVEDQSDPSVGIETGVSPSTQRSSPVPDLGRTLESDSSNDALGSSPPEVPLGLTMEEVEAIRENLDLLHANADRAALMEGYRQVTSRMPDDFGDEAHNAHLDVGDYVVVGQVKSSSDGSDDPVSVPVTKARPEFHGQIRITRLPSGELVRTTVGLLELGRDAELAVELTWFERNMRRR